MILLDVNVLVWAHRPEFSAQADAGAWLERALADPEPVAVWDVLLASAFRVLTHPRLVREQDAPRRALRFLQEVRDATVLVRPGDRHWSIFRELIEQTHATGYLVTDASIAAVAIENECRLATFDGDFARFPGLRWFAPT